MATITKQLLVAIRPDLDRALAEVASKHGLSSLKSGQCSFDHRSGNFTMKIEGIGEGGVDKDGARYNLALRDRLIDDLPPLGTEFENGGVTYKIVGINSTLSKILVTKGEGERYLFPTEMLCSMLKRRAELKKMVAPVVEGQPS